MVRIQENHVCKLPGTASSTCRHSGNGYRGDPTVIIASGWCGCHRAAVVTMQLGDKGPWTAWSPPADVDLSAQAPVIRYRLSAQLAVALAEHFTPEGFFCEQLIIILRLSNYAGPFLFFKQNTYNAFMPLVKQKRQKPQTFKAGLWFMLLA